MLNLYLEMKTILERVDWAVKSVPIHEGVMTYLRAAADPIYAAAPDSFTETFPDTPTKYPGSIVIYNQDDPEEIFDALRSYDIGNVRGPAPRLARTLKHERQHRLAALDLGALGAIIGLQLVNAGSADRPIINGDFYFSQSYGLTVTKLGVAAIALYPEADGGPSPGDLVATSNIGYPGGVMQVGPLIVARNYSLAEGERPYPVPLTYNPQATVIIPI